MYRFKSKPSILLSTLMSLSLLNTNAVQAETANVESVGDNNDSHNTFEVQNKKIESLEKVTEQKTLKENEDVIEDEPIEDDTQTGENKISESEAKVKESTDEIEIPSEEEIDDAKIRIAPFNAVLDQTPSAEELYDAVINAKFAYEAWEDVQVFKELYPDDSRLQEAIDIAAGYIFNQGVKNHQLKDFAKATEAYAKILSDKMVNTELYEITNSYYNQAIANQNLVTIEELYDSIVGAKYAYEAWDRSQKFKVLYPNNPLTKEAVNIAAEYVLRQGIITFERQEYDKAIPIFEKLNVEALINPDTKEIIQSYYNNAVNLYNKQHGDKLYNSIMNAQFAYQAWDDANLFEELYPTDSRLQEAVDVAAGYMLNQGIKSHDRGDYARAAEVYAKILANDTVSSAIYTETQTRYNFALEGRTLPSANALYDSIMNAQFAYQAWDDANLFEELYPTDSRLQESVDVAAGYMLNQGIKNHRLKDFNKANEVYTKILLNQTVSSQIYETTKLLSSQSENKINLRTADELYKSVLNAKYAYQAWDEAQYFKTVYPRDSRVKEIINIAADYQLNQGIKNHQNLKYSNALTSYEKLLKEDLIASNIRTFLNSVYPLAKNGRQLETEKQYIQKIKNSSSATKFNLSVEGHKIYPNSSELRKLLNETAVDYLAEGREHHRKRNKSAASNIYNKIISESKVNSSIRTLAEVFNNQLDEKHIPLIYIDPGHGHRDPGAVHGGVREKDLNLNTASYLKEALESRGYQVVLSRDTDVYLELIDRATGANALKADVFISVHYNSLGGSGAARGIETFIHHTVSSGFGQETDRKKFRTDNPRISESLSLADDIHNELIRSTGFYNRGVKGNNYSVLRNTNIPAVLLELGFIDNDAERSVIRTSSYQKKAAEAVANGIDKYFKAIK